MNRTATFCLGAAVGSAINAVIIGAMSLATPVPAPAPTPVEREILIGSNCDAGPEIVAADWSDPALEGCKDIRVHEVLLTAK